MTLSGGRKALTATTFNRRLRATFFIPPVCWPSGSRFKAPCYACCIIDGNDPRGRRSSAAHA
jgi:hypothetical protein